MEFKDSRTLINHYIKDCFYNIVQTQERHVKLASDYTLSRTEMHSIELIVDSENPILTEIAEQLRVSKATASVSIERLVQKGFVLKNKFENDKRKYYLSLSEKGRVCYNKHREFHEKMIDAILNDFMIDEYPQVLAGLKGLANFLENYNKKEQL